MIQRGLEILARTLFCLAALAGLTACGSGAVGSIVTDPGKITILPPGTDLAPAVLYSGLPTTFSITGGTGAYIVTSSNQAVLPVSGPLSGSTLTVIPNGVTTDTTLTLTARDTGTTLPTTITLVVRPGTVSNTITVTPASTACAPAICSGGDAVVSTVISQGGIPIPGRLVRFEVVSGDFRFITSGPGEPETTALSVTTTTDETGTARARLRVLTTAANQTGIFQITDLSTGAFQRSTIFIAQVSPNGSFFFAVPSSVTFTGPRVDLCATGALSAQVFVFGGTPPYTVSNPSPAAMTISPTFIPASGGSFMITPSGVCFNLAVPITDSAGRTITVDVTNQPGTAPVPTPTPLQVAPTTVTLSSCTQTTGVFVVGGTGSYQAQSNNPLVFATVSNNLVTIRRAAGTTNSVPPVTSVTVGITDGTSHATVDVTLSGAGAGPCP